MKSLQDQLRKAGLIDEQAAKKVASEKRKKQKASRKGKAKVDNPSSSPTGSAMRERNADRDRALNREKQAAQEKRAITAQIKQLVTTNEVKSGGEDTAYHFVHGGKVKTLHIDEILRGQMVAGHLSIVALVESKSTRYALVPDAVARKVAERDMEAVIRIEPDEISNPNGEEDPYAGFEVPDDLMW